MIEKSSYRNPSYLAWVRKLNCYLCNRPADDAHHITGVGKLSGMGMKAPDTFAMPVCRVCHQRIHGEPNLWEGQWEAVARTLHRAIKEGVL